MTATSDVDGPDAQEAPVVKSGGKGGHFLSARDKEILDAGPDPFASLDKRRRTEKRDERRAHQQRYSQVRRQALDRARAALADLWWLAGTMDKEFVRDAFLAESVPGVTWTERVLHEVTGKAGWLPVPATLGGKGEFFAQRLVLALESGLAPDDPAAPRPSVVLTLHPAHGPLKDAAPLGRARQMREERRARARKSRPASLQEAPAAPKADEVLERRDM